MLVTEYALKRIKDGFKESKDVTDEKKLLALRNSALENLQVIKRQVVIGEMYSAAPLVIEKKETNENKS
ncbi:LYR motif-containing protein 4 [Armadillidium nasatum]|uniref:LYR motif-containing protein 4 n=1 Tax=Armadillidium nasatum TaxID=96803 RepID=A0A5N5T7U9_9CRUS|nr:LYR motif-containing protein 4 [Armadillidium nasatum]